jgi:ABC-type glutathione transport system ATPase component
VLESDGVAHNSAGPLLRVEHLVVAYGDGRRSHSATVAVDDVSLSLRERTTLGVIGESGSGKSTLCRALLKLVPVQSGTIHIQDVDILKASRAELRRVRRNYQAVFQDPFSSLDPRWTTCRIVAEPLRIHHLMRAPARRMRAMELLEAVGLPAEVAGRLPHQLSGGQRQRVAIARSLALNPSLLILDEPLSALDVSVQAQITNLLVELQRRLGLTYLVVAHDMAAIRRLSDDIMVMYRGKVVEHGPAERVFTQPEHPYTRALLAAAPMLADPRIG